ncbi:MAG: hypothetical protein AB7D06_07170 [Pedobacter sp.]
MPKKKAAENAYIFRPPGDNHWMDIAALIASSIPNALVSRLGKHFGALYYKNIARCEYSYCLAAFDNTGRLAGVILGTLDHDAAKSLDFALKIRLLLAANIRLFPRQYSAGFYAGCAPGMQQNIRQKIFRRPNLSLL